MGEGSVSVSSACLRGAQAQPVQVEVASSGGIPGLTIVGMPDAGVLDARSRVRCALKACGFKMPRLHFTINLAPGSIKKTGTGFDLPIAVAILMLSGQIPRQGLEHHLYVGELGLDGSVCATRGTVAYQLLARRHGRALVCGGGACGASGSKGDVRALVRLSDLRSGEDGLRRAARSECVPAGCSGADGELDFKDVYGQEEAKRAMLIAAAGRHGLLMVGPPGSGKTMLARRLPSILPPLDDEELEEVLLLHSVSGQDLSTLSTRQRPFRAPHHSISLGGLVGGGRPVIPGEISLAHRGVLFLDELPEFASNVLQALRQPMEDRAVRLVRVDGVYSFPCDFQLIAAANPCPCGYLGDEGHHCRCSPARILQYQGRIGGPLMDRIGLHVEVRRPGSGIVIAGEGGMDSRSMRERVCDARERACWRERRVDGDGPSLASALCFDAAASSALEGLASRLALGGRSIVRMARVARTIADVEQSDLVLRPHVLEASSYRNRLGEEGGAHV